MKTKIQTTPDVRTPPVLEGIDQSLISNEKLQAAIKRVMDRAGRGDVEARYDRQHHRHNKS